jgi:hypothetical protein
MLPDGGVTNPTTLLDHAQSTAPALDADSSQSLVQQSRGYATVREAGCLAHCKPLPCKYLPFNPLFEEGAQRGV